MAVLVTGANGFVGSALTAELGRRGWVVRGAVRRDCPQASFPFECFSIGDVHGGSDWSGALKGIDNVIHLVGRTHVTTESDVRNLEGYRQINVHGTRHLAEQAARAGVKRLVFVSSVKVNGEQTSQHAFTSRDVPAPSDAYGISKWEAEQALGELADATGLETVIVRPPLVYGPGVRANFARLMGWVSRGLPLPLGAINNRRSLVALPNLVDLLVRCLEVPHAQGYTFMVSDGQDISTPNLVNKIASAMGKHPRLVPVPVTALKLVGGLTGRVGEVRRLCGSLQVDIAETREILGWVPPVSVHDAVKETVDAYVKDAN